MATKAAAGFRKMPALSAGARGSFVSGMRAQLRGKAGGSIAKYGAKGG